jgi:hypothetical protein
MTREPHPKLPIPDKKIPPAGTPGHEDAMLDEADEESFPASDPSAPTQPHRKPADKGTKR